jgi:molybdopterin molybdotransferase
MIAFDDAAAAVAAFAQPLAGETVRLERADGRVLAEPVVARRASPQTAVSAMDGYAVREADLQAGPARLKLIGESFAGAGFDGELARGTCVRIFTGAPAPRGAERVVIQEEARREGELVVLAPAPGAGRHLRAAASDFSPGDVLVPAGAVLDPQKLIAAAAADLAVVEVVRRPRVVILSTGDELREPGALHAAASSIPESVSFGVAALVWRFGGEVVARRRLADDLGCLQRAAAAALEACDVVVTTGGASVGERDFSKAMFEPLGLELAFSKVAIKPGKPVWLGRVDERLVVGLPGNPTAALLTARLILAPLLAGLSGRAPQSALDWRTAPLATPIEACGPRETFYRGRATGEGMHLLDDQDSSAQKALASADHLIRRRPGDQAAGVGELVPVLAL